MICDLHIHSTFSDGTFTPEKIVQMALESGLSAVALILGGYAKTIDEAFEKYLSKDSGFYREPERISVWEMLSVLKSIGAAPVLAHPFLQLTEQNLREFSPKAKEIEFKINYIT